MNNGQVSSTITPRSFASSVLLGLHDFLAGLHAHILRLPGASEIWVNGFGMEFFGPANGRID
jgi:hypothetical protein